MATVKPRIVQCLCGSARHCIAAVIYQPGETVVDGLVLTQETAADCLRALLDENLKNGVNPWCGICGNPRERWIFEDNPTKFKSLEEAMPEVRRLEQEQRRAADFFRAAKN